MIIECNLQNSQFDSEIAIYEKLVELYCKCNDKQDCQINIRFGEWFNAELSAMLGGILTKIMHNNEITFFFFGSDQVKTILSKNGFLSEYCKEVKMSDTNNTTIPYYEFCIDDKRSFGEYIQNKLFIHPSIPKMKDDLQQKIQQSIAEIFVNARMHSKSDYIYVCGQYFPKKHLLSFCIVDMGIGFAKSIQNKIGQTINSKQAILWAFNKGSTTKKHRPGGLGLSLLKDFIRANEGSLIVLSGNALFAYKNGQENVKILNDFFDGVVVNMIFKTDDHREYFLQSEQKNHDDLF